MSTENLRLHSLTCPSTIQLPGGRKTEILTQHTYFQTCRVTPFRGGNLIVSQFRFPKFMETDCFWKAKLLSSILCIFPAVSWPSLQHRHPTSFLFKLQTFVCCDPISTWAWNSKKNGSKHYSSKPPTRPVRVFCSRCFLDRSNMTECR